MNMIKARKGRFTQDAVLVPGMGLAVHEAHSFVWGDKNLQEKAVRLGWHYIKVPQKYNCFSDWSDWEIVEFWA